MDENVLGTQLEEADDSRFIGYNKGEKDIEEINSGQLKEIEQKDSLDNPINLNGKSTKSFEQSLKELNVPECNNLEAASVNELNTSFQKCESNVDKRMEQNMKNNNFPSSPFDDLPRRLSESLEYSIVDSSNSVRREKLHSASDNEEDLLEVTKDLPKIHSFGSPGTEPLGRIEACNFQVKYNATEETGKSSVPLVSEVLDEYFTREGPEKTDPMFTLDSENHSRYGKKDSYSGDSVFGDQLQPCDAGVTSNINTHGLAKEVFSSNSNLDPDATGLPHKLSPFEVSSSPIFEVDPLGCSKIAVRTSPALVHVKHHTQVHPAVSIEITAPDESEQENIRRGCSQSSLEVTETDFHSRNPISSDSDGVRGEGLSSSSSPLSEGIGFSALSAEEKHSGISKFISKIRTRSSGDTEGGSSWRSSTSSVFGDAVDFTQYDSDASVNSSSASRPVSPSDSRLFAKVHSKVKDKHKRKKAAQYLKSGNGHRRNSDSVVNERDKKIFLEVPGESSDFHQTIEETNLARSSELSKSDSRLNEKGKSVKKNRRLSESRVIVKLKGLKNKMSHHGSIHSLSPDSPQEVALSPDPFADNMQTGRGQDGHLAPREVNFQHSESYYDNLKLAPPAARSRSTSPMTGGKKGTGSDFALADIAVDDYYEKMESIYDESHQETPKRKPFFSLEGLRNVFRGKSRSVDHTGLAPSFPFESLRRSGSTHSSAADSVEGSKENVAPSDKSSSAASIILGSTSSLSAASKAPSAPTTTTTYTVSGNDTLMSIAARFDTTPSELTKLNRLSSRHLFPGQSLLVPLRSGQPGALEEPDPAGPHQTSPPGSQAPASSADLDRLLDQECLERFLKLQVRHVTDGQGIVGGVLLVTPNALMFDPDVSDPLVLERGGADTYGFICPMECLANAAIYNDIATMRVKDTKLPRPELPKPEIYYSPAMKKSALASAAAGGLNSLKVCAADGGAETEADSPLLLTKDATFPELSAASGEGGKATSSTGSQDDDSSCSCGGDTRDSSAFPKAFEQELLTPDTYPHSPLPVHDDAPDSSSLTPPILKTAFDSHDTTPSSLDVHHDSLSSGILSQPLMTIDEDTTTAVPSVDSSATVGKLASRNVSCDSAVSVSSEVDLVVGGSVDSTYELVDTREAPAAATPPLHHHLPEDGLAPSQASRKQKVLKRLSNPLSWMDSLGSDGGGSVGSVGGSSGGGSTPPIGGGQSTAAPHPHPPSDAPDARQLQQGGGVLSSVFSMTSNVTSNVSNMLTRRPSLDLVRRSSPHSSHEALPTSAPASSAAINTAGTNKRAQFKDGSNVGFRSLVPVDDVTNLFSSVDRMVGRKSADTEEAPLYLCLRMGLPRRLPRSPFLSYGTKVIKAEYWFSIPRSKAPDLCRLLDLWGCGIYGEVDEQKISERGLTLILEDRDLALLEDKLPSASAEATNGGTQLKEITKESWEVPMHDDLRLLLSSTSMSSVDIEAFLPEMLDPSEIVDHQTFKSLYRNLPPRFQSYSWHLTFSTAQHGFSLSSLYRKMQEVQDSPVVLAVQDTQQTIFGALLSNSFKVSDSFYGTGESFIFTCYPSFQTCHWTAENTYFIKGNNESLVIGGGDGFGIWLDGDLYRGRSQPCKTYNNPVLGPSEDFVIKTIECWSFV